MDKPLITEEAIDRVARAFHERYEDLAPLYGYVTREDTRLPWDQVPDANRNLMRGTVLALLEEGTISIGWPVWNEVLSDDTCEVCGHAIVKQSDGQWWHSGPGPWTHRAVR